MSGDDHRTVRAELHAARCRDKEQTELRLWNDARELDRRMVAAGFEVKNPTLWGMSPAAWNARHAAQAQAGGTITTSDGPDCQPEPAAAPDEPEEWEMQA